MRFAAVAVLVLTVAGGLAAAAGARPLAHQASGATASKLSAGAAAKIASLTSLAGPGKFSSLFSVSSDAGFEGADGNLTNDGTMDWNDFSPLTWSGPAPYQTSGTTAGGWTFYGVSDAVQVNDTTYAGGVKQADECPTIIHTATSGTQNKADLARIYLAGKIVNGDTYLALAWVRAPQNTTSSDVHVAFEFNQSKSACGATSDSLVHRTDGDILIVYNFQSGSASLAYSTWQSTPSPGAWTAEQTIPSTLASAKVFDGTSTTDALKPTGAPNPATDEFGEAIIDLSQASISLSGGNRECVKLGTAFGESRSSGSSTSAQMEDLVGPANVDLSNCVTPDLSTTQSPASANIGGILNDTATLANGNSPTKSITFNLFGPNNATCDPNGAAPVYTQTVGVSGNGSYSTTPGYTATAAGTYQWVASYPGDGNNNATSTSCGDEPVAVAKNTTSITTTLSATTGAIGDKVHDGSTLTGATANAAGTATYTVYTNNTCTNAAVAGTDIDAQPAGVTVSGGAVPNSPDVTFLNAGDYYWQVVYSGDANNLGSTSPCTANDNEHLHINPNTTSITTTLSATTGAIGDKVHDGSTLSGATANAAGTATYTVYTNNSCTSAAVAGTDIDAQPAGVTVSGGAVPNSPDVSFLRSGDFYWRVVYSGDSNNTGSTSPCTANDNEHLHINPNTTSITTTLSATTGAIGDKVHDGSTLSGATANAGGTATYTVYTNNTCTSAAVAGTDIDGQPAAVTVSAGTVPNSPDVTFLRAGDLYWRVVYSGDSNNGGSSSPCTANDNEHLHIDKNTTSITTTLSATTGAIGGKVHDGSTLHGATANAAGTATYAVYTNNTCTTPAAAGTDINAQPDTPLTVTNGVVPNSADVTFLKAGDYYWRVVYSGDANNTGSTSPCTADDNEHLVIGKNTTSITTTLSATTGAIGDKVHDGSTLTGATANAGGTATYRVYTNNTCTTLAVAGTDIDAQPADVTVAGHLVPNSADVTFLKAGDFYWQVVYSGDANNASSTSPCTANDNEHLHINKNTTSITTLLSATSAGIGDKVHDGSTLTGATADAGGSATYTVYTNNTCTSAAVVGTDIDAQPADVTVAGHLVPNSADVTFLKAGDFYWQVVYSGDANNSGSTSPCTANDNEHLHINKNTTSITTLLSATSAGIGDKVHDGSTLTGATADAGGSATYTVYTNNTCTSAAVVGTDIDAQPADVTVASHLVPNSADVTFLKAGDFYWQVVYSGDANNSGSTSPCTANDNEHLHINKNTTSITTLLSATSAGIGDKVHDGSTLSGATADAGGSATYSVYTNNTCTTLATVGTDIDAQPADVTVAGHLVPDSGDVTFLKAGDFYWQVVYSGDANNASSTSPCTANDNEHLHVAPNSPTIATTLSGTEVLVGSNVHDSATLTGATATAGGTVTYTVYTNDTCTTDARDAGTKTVTNGTVPDSNALAFPDAGTFYWQASYSGDTNNAAATSACTDEQLLVDRPAIAITKNPKSQTINGGETANFTITVTNTGTTTLTDVAVTDALAPDCAKTIGTLTAGQSTSYDCSLADVTASFTNSATATGHPPVGPDVTATDTAKVTVRNKPTISTTLSSGEVLVGSNVHDSAKLTGATENAGGSVTYTVYTNDTCTTGARDAGTKTVTNGTVPDSNALAFPDAGTFYWQASYSGDANNEAATSACTDEQLLVDRPAISITKNPKSQAIDSGGTANFTITVTNTGTVDLTNVTVTDALAPGCAKAIGPLGVGKSTSYTCSLSGVAAAFTNSATATGHPPVGPDVTATDTAGVTVNAIPPPPPPPPPAPTIDLQITKTGTPNPAILGNQVTWTLTVKNNGPSNATGVTVADPIPAGMTFVSATSTQGTCTGGAMLNCAIGAMANGATVTVTLVTSAGATGVITNTTTVVGNEAETNTANNTASAQVTVKGPFVPPPAVCTALGVTPKQLFVGRKNTLTMKVTQKGKSVAGIRVQINGSTLRIVTAPSNGQGIVKRAVKPLKAGIVTFRPVAKKSCANPRIGVIGVFTPPVTG